LKGEWLDGGKLNFLLILGEISIFILKKRTIKLDENGWSEKINVTLKFGALFEVLLLALASQQTTNT
jgi:hypothetical protein